MYTRLLCWLCASWLVVGCARPYLNPEGMLVFAPAGSRGAAVVTSDGIVFRDVIDPPERVVFRDPAEPWRAPIGFLLPRSGRFHRTSTPVTLQLPALAVVLRSSDTRMPAWGGEILVRVDAHALGSAAQRPGEHLVVVTDVERPATTLTALGAALDNLGACDRLTIIDSHGPRVLVPELPATHRALAMAAAAQTNVPPSSPRRLAEALRLATQRASDPHDKRHRRFLVLSSDTDLPPRDDSSDVLVVDPQASDTPARVASYVPPAGVERIRDLTIRFEGVPAPSHVLESSGGEVLWVLDGGVVSLGRLLAGQARYEVLRVSVPAWVPGTRFRLSAEVTATLAEGGGTVIGRTTLEGIYDDDIENIAESRHGDVIAYASALATMSKLQDAFVRPGQRPHDLIRVARLQAQSLSLLARDFPNRGFTEDAQVLEMLLRATSSAAH